MHVHFEDTSITRSDCTVHSLSWMGKVPEVLPDEEGWKLNRVHYYQEGWLASGNAKGIVGVTFTTCHCKKAYEGPPRLNFNLRGHRSEVVLVKWNEPYQKLATCDVNGVIFVWIKHEGRWSIELINDRNSQVTDFAWSHDGRMALICYRDGYVLVGSVAGQRYWSTILNLDNTLITCGVWTPDDERVIFGTTEGQVIVMSANGNMVARATIQEGAEIMSLSWSCEKFNMEENDMESNGESRDVDSKEGQQDYTLCVCFKQGTIYLMSSYDDPCPRVVQTNLTGMRVEWCSDGELLAVAGFVRQPNLECTNYLHFYTREGVLHYATSIPSSQGKPLTAITWGHSDKRLFIAVGCYIHTAWVTKTICSLQLFCRRTIHRCLKDDGSVQKLPLPTRLRSMVEAFFSPTIKGYIPDPFQLRKFISVSPPGNERLHCTMMRHGEENLAGYYTLYLEYLGGLVPILKGKRASKLKPEFIIFDPKLKLSGKDEDDPFSSSTSPSSESDSDADVAIEPGCGSPRMQRKRRRRRHSRPADKSEQKTHQGAQRSVDEILYDDNLPESNVLVEVTSNIWGTKFKIHGIAPFLPVDLGQVLYKTSLLHLQPRQMTVTITEMSGDLRPSTCDDRTAYNPNSFSESEDEMNGGSGVLETPAGFQGSTSVEDGVVAISPITSDPVIRQTNEENGLFPGLYPVKVEVPDKLSPLPRSSCDTREGSSSPPQKRSPSFKGQSLSPAEQLPFTSNSLVDGALDAQFLSREAYTNQGAIPKTCKPIVSTNILEECNVVKTSNSVLSSQSCVMHHHHNAASSDSKPEISGWTAQPAHDIKYIDDEEECHHGDQTVTRPVQRLVAGSPGSASNSSLSKDAYSRTAYSEMNGVELNGLVQPTGPKVTQKRLVLAQPKPPKHRDSKHKNESIKNAVTSVPPSSVEWRKSQSLELLPGAVDGSGLGANDDRTSPPEGDTACPMMYAYNLMKKGEIELKKLINDIETTSAEIEADISRTRRKSCDDRKLHSTSLPSSPARKLSNHRKCKIRSPLLSRKVKSHKGLDSSDEEGTFSAEDITTSENYRNLETFQKAQLKLKVPGKSRKPPGHIVRFYNNHQAQLCRSIVCVRSVRLLVQLKKSRTKSESEHSAGLLPEQHQFVMHNKAPLWNENSQVYQLDFGGRVTQESAKNFQIEFRGKQVMQFGRIDGNAYTLDFQYPFTAVQAFAVALANVTQRLK